ncbi:hypothetical protein [Sinomonas soli]
MNRPYRTRKNAVVQRITRGADGTRHVDRPLRSQAVLDYRTKQEFERQLTTFARRAWPSARFILIDQTPKHVESNGVTRADGSIFIDGEECAYYFLHDPAQPSADQPELVP